MYIEKVKLLGNADEYGGRALEIRCKNRSFTTPLRIPTSTEYRYRQNVPIEPSINSPISEIVSDFTKKEMDAFLQGNGPFKTRLGSANENAIMMSYSSLLFYPQYPNGYYLTERNRREFIELQLSIVPDDKPISLITYPFIWSSNIKQEVTKLIDEIEQRTDGNSEIVPYIDLGMDKHIFENSLKLLTRFNKSDSIHMVGLIYRPRILNIQNYLTLWDNRENNTLWMHISGVPRRGYNTSPPAEIHAFQYYGIDTFSIKTKRAYAAIKKETDSTMRTNVIKKRELDPKNILRFDSSSLGYLKEQEWFNEYPLDNQCDCPVCNHKNREEFKKQYIKGHDGHTDPARLNEANKVHELFSSSKEFLESKDYIQEGDFKGYVKMKKYFPEIRKKSKQTTLNGR